MKPSLLLAASRARVGRTLGLTLYAQRGDSPDKADIFLGLFSTQEDAQCAATALNKYPAPPGPRWRAIGRLIYPSDTMIDLDDFIATMVDRDVAAMVAKAVNEVPSG